MPLENEEVNEEVNGVVTEVVTAGAVGRYAPLPSGLL